MCGPTIWPRSACSALSASNQHWPTVTYHSSGRHVGIYCEHFKLAAEVFEALELKWSDKSATFVHLSWGLLRHGKARPGVVKSRLCSSDFFPFQQGECSWYETCHIVSFLCISGTGDGSLVLFQERESKLRQDLVNYLSFSDQFSEDEDVFGIV